MEKAVANEENLGPAHEGAPEEEALLERSSAPTVRDLRAAAKGLFKAAEAEPAPTPPNDGPRAAEDLRNPDYRVSPKRSPSTSKSASGAAAISLSSSSAPPLRAVIL